MKIPPYIYGGICGAAFSLDRFGLILTGITNSDLDTQPGGNVSVVDHPSVRTISFAVLKDEDIGFNPTPWTRLVIRCERGGEIKVRILEGRSSGA